MHPKELREDGNGGHIWNGTNQKFQGYTARALEDLTKNVNEIKTTNEKQWGVISKNKERLDVTEGKTKAQAAYVSLFVSLAVLTIGWVLTNLPVIAKFFGGG